MLLPVDFSGESDVAGSARSAEEYVDTGGTCQIVGLSTPEQGGAVSKSTKFEWSLSFQ